MDTNKWSKRFTVFSFCLSCIAWVGIGDFAYAQRTDSAGKPAPETVSEPVEAEISFTEDAPIPPSVMPVVVLSGSDYDMGYQYYQQLIQIFGPWVTSHQWSAFGTWTFRPIKHGEFTEEELAALKAYQWYIKKHAPEFIDFFRGMADGATDAGVELSYADVLNNALGNLGGNRAYPGTEPPGSGDDELPPSGCSGFAAWGSTTKDGKPIYAGSNDSQEGFFATTVVVFPETGNNFITATPNPVGFGYGPVHPAVNNKGLTYVHHGAGLSGNEEPGYGVPPSMAILHTLRFADDADEALEMELAYPGRHGGFWADVDGNAFVTECRDPLALRRAGDCGETDFLYATNNTLSPKLEEFIMPHPQFGRIYIPHGGWLGGEMRGALPFHPASITRNLGVFSMLDNYQGEVDLDFVKMMWRFPGEPPPDYPTLEEAEAAYATTYGAGWDPHICHLANATLAIVLPDDGDEGLYYVSTGCAARVAHPLGPVACLNNYPPAKTYSFFELKLASGPKEVTIAAENRAQHRLYYANQELGKLNYWDAPYAPLDEIFNQAATEFYKGQYYLGLVLSGMTTGNESIYNYSKALRCFNRSEAFANQVYNALVPPATSPEDLGLHPYTPLEYEPPKLNPK